MVKLLFSNVAVLWLHIIAYYYCVVVVVVLLLLLIILHFLLFQFNVFGTVYLAVVCSLCFCLFLVCLIALD